MATNNPFINENEVNHGTPSAGAAMSAVLVLEHENLIGPDLRWPLRIARLGKADITLLVCVTEKNIRTMKDVDLSMAVDQPEWADRIADRMRSVLDDYLGTGQWTGSFPAKPIIKKDEQKDYQQLFIYSQFSNRW